MLKLLGLILLFGFLVNCEEVEEDQTAPSPTEITGVWQGLYKSLEGAEEIVDVSLSLGAEGFELRRTNTDRVVLGQYDVFSELNSLTLRVSESTDETLALNGVILDYSYQLIGRELLLEAKDHIFRLKRPDGDLPTETSSSWECEQADNVWQMTLSADFFVLYLENSGGAPLFLTGTVAVEERKPGRNEQAISLAVTDGQPLIPFTQLNGLLLFEDSVLTQIELTARDQDGDSNLDFMCNIQELE